MTMTCTSCGCACSEEQDAKLHEGSTDSSVENYREETEFAVLLALVPAMAMTLFNMMGFL